LIFFYQQFFLQLGKPGNAEPNKNLIFHVHGGGWAAQTSKSHELYLREWVKKLKIPMISVDYSLAPEAPFPRALEEVFYVYCWVLKNPQLVGWTGENFVFVGDSAGGNLNTACIVQCIEHGVRIPTGLFNIYAPQWIGFAITPARFMSLIDPVLPYGFTSRLFKSYGAKQEQVPIIHEQRRKETKFEKQRKKYERPEQEFEVEVHDSHLLSPYLAPDAILAQFPRTKLLSTNLDPCLDDGIEFGKKLKSLNVDVSLDILTGLAHGFLYFTQVKNILKFDMLKVIKTFNFRLQKIAKMVPLCAWSELNSFLESKIKTSFKFLSLTMEIKIHGEINQRYIHVIKQQPYKNNQVI
jgi:acetyl esterase/lipase